MAISCGQAKSVPQQKYRDLVCGADIAHRAVHDESEPLAKPKTQRHYIKTPESHWLQDSFELTLRKKLTAWFGASAVPPDLSSRRCREEMLVVEIGPSWRWVLLRMLAGGWHTSSRMHVTPEVDSCKFANGTPSPTTSSARASSTSRASGALSTLRGSRGRSRSTVPERPENQRSCEVARGLTALPALPSRDRAMQPERTAAERAAVARAAEERRLAQAAAADVQARRLKPGDAAPLSPEAAEVEAFLASSGLDRYLGPFLEHGFDCMDVVRDMEESHMRDVGAPSTRTGAGRPPTACPPLAAAAAAAQAPPSRGAGAADEAAAAGAAGAPPPEGAGPGAEGEAAAAQAGPGEGAAAERERAAAGAPPAGAGRRAVAVVVDGSVADPQAVLLEVFQAASQLVGAALDGPPEGRSYERTVMMCSKLCKVLDQVFKNLGSADIHRWSRLVCSSSTFQQTFAEHPQGPPLLQLAGFGPCPEGDALVLAAERGEARLRALAVRQYLAKLTESCRRGAARGAGWTAGERLRGAAARARTRLRFAAALPRGCPGLGPSGEPAA
ncbi:unnamed protein product [Prorocentrum cordatum]|uniref:Uncharacterized protein n=1 Tax=Prorocentrum cordatum TaxID=2364126 RepID=A0ABN9S1Y3_9DINO|nr:unnamed protein product [Polarella glacialis]